ncbi:DNA-directed RNA polymerase subunit E [Pyrolobus fumarii 1A]|uniref:Transcription elongation factor Spt4 n=1 Tax=Pyrolobus fumarii (strain DSM 11204 / 1A) TaxID=694429 RepID=G0EF82_PYRF1|nr:transcription elongation factor subunit Spt4 [Pyrolobus fumarii]AEM38125.1 DNA-directed RNA polymerase subunit E [Pyrolobus fumarii 1A]
MSAATRRTKRAPFRACRSCHALVPKEVDRCPYCGSTDLTEEWAGVAIILDTEKSVLIKYMPVRVEKPGRYAIRVY